MNSGRFSTNPTRKTEAVSEARLQYRDTRLPIGWAKTNLNAVVWSVSTKADPNENRDERYIGLEHIVSGEGELRRIGNATEVKSVKTKFLPGDILYGKLRPYLNKITMPNFPGICSTDILVLRPESQIEKGFIEAVLRTKRFIDFATNSSSGINLPRTSFSKIAPFELSLAPAKEQKRIAIKLQRLLSREHNVRRQLDVLHKLIHQYRTAVLETAFAGELVPTEAEIARREHRNFEAAPIQLKRILTERREKWESEQLAKPRTSNRNSKSAKRNGKYPVPVEPKLPENTRLPEGWTWASLEQITDPTRVICYGILMPKAHFEGGIPYVKVRDIKEDAIDLSSLQRTSPKIASKYVRSTLSAGDLLLSIRGTYGRVAQVPKELEGGNITQDTARIAILSSIQTAFIAWQLRSTRMQEYFHSIARGVAVKGVNIGDIRPTAIALPPIAEQKRILDEVERRLSTIAHVSEELRTALRECDALRSEIYNRAASGDLVEQDSGDEEANKLLALIETERHKRLQAPKPKNTKQKVKMKKLSPDVVKEVILKLPNNRFSFDQLAAALQAEYEPTKDVLFRLLDEPKPILHQVFDSKTKTMKLERKLS